MSHFSPPSQRQLTNYCVAKVQNRLWTSCHVTIMYHKMIKKIMRSILQLLTVTDIPDIKCLSRPTCSSVQFRWVFIYLFIDRTSAFYFSLTTRSVASYINMLRMPRHGFKVCVWTLQRSVNGPESPVARNSKLLVQLQKNSKDHITSLMLREYKNHQSRHKLDGGVQELTKPVCRAGQGSKEKTNIENNRQ